MYAISTTPAMRKAIFFNDDPMPVLKSICANLIRYRANYKIIFPIPVRQIRLIPVHGEHYLSGMYISFVMYETPACQAVTV